MVNWADVDQHTRKWIYEAGENIRTALTNKIDISTKADKNDLVTNVDKSTEQFFIEKIKSSYPSHKILGEEGYGDELHSTDGIIWVIDPIDGTMNFVHQKRNFMISIGIYENGIGQLGYIFDVIHEELYFGRKGGGAFFNNEPLEKLKSVTVDKAIIGINSLWVTENRRTDYKKLAPLVKAARGTRSYGSAALEMGYIACGWMDAYMTPRLAPWDFAAGKIIVEELGGKATTMTGEPLSILKGSSVLFAKPGLHEQILANYLNTHAE